MFGIDAHKSILTHSVLIGAALETGFLSLVQLVRLVHAKLPANHDPLWDSIAKHADAIAQAANTGASLGMSYHLLVDGLVQPRTTTSRCRSRWRDTRTYLSATRWPRQSMRPTSPVALLRNPRRRRSPSALQGHGKRPGTLVDPFVADMLADDELLIVERCGSWLQGLAIGALRPLSAAQQRFVDVTKGLAPAESPHEQAWMMYRGLLE